MERGRIQGLSKFFWPLLSRERVKLLTSNLASTFRGPIRIKAHKIGEKGAWANFWVLPIISGTGKAMDFKFYTNMHRVDRNKSP